MASRILIIGGYGYAGNAIAKLLLEQTDLEIVIGGRDLQKARSLADRFNRSSNKNRVDAIAVDASSRPTLLEAFSKIQLVVVASPTVQYTRTVCDAALEAGIDYIDCQISAKHKIEVLQQLKPRIERNEHCFITDAGYHPGLPGIMVQRAAEVLDVLETAQIGVLMKIDWSAYKFTDTSALELLGELNHYKPLLFNNGLWHENWKAVKTFDFGAPFGEYKCMPFYLEELRSLPTQHPAIRNLECYLTSFNPVTNRVAIPLTIIGTKLSAEKGARRLAPFFRWTLERFSKPPYGNVLKMEAIGEQADETAHMQIEIRHNDPYALTAAPVVACIQQYLKKRQAGLWFPAQYVEPGPFFDNLKKMGIEVYERIH